MLRRDAGEDHLARERCLELLFVHRVQLPPRYQAADPFLPHHPDAPGHALSGEAVVSGHHDDADAGQAALLHGEGHLCAGGIVHRHESQKHELPLHLLSRIIREPVREPPLGHRQDPVPLPGVEVDGLKQLVLCLRRERQHAPLPGNGAAKRRHLPRRPLHEGGFALSLPVDARHPLPVGIERDLAQARQAPGLLGGIHPPLERRDLQRRLGRVTHHAPAPPCGGRGDEPRVVAKGGGYQEPAHLCRERVFHPPSRGCDLPLRRISHAAHRVTAPGNPHLPHRHLVLGKRPGLVGADHRAAAKRLHRGEALHQGVSPRHALDRHGQRQGHRGEEPLRHEGDHHPHGEDEAGMRLAMHDSHREEEEEDADAKGHTGDQAGHPVDLLLQRGGGVGGARGEMRDPAELGLHPGCEDHPAAGAGHRTRPGKEEVRKLAPGERFPGYRVGALSGGMGFSRQGGLVDPQVPLLDQPDIGGNPASLGDDDQIARDQFLRGNLPFHPVADHGGLGGEQPFKRLHRPLRTVLLEEGEHRVDDHDGPDGPPELGHPPDKRHGASPPKEKRHEMGEVRQELKVERLPGGGPDRVAAARRQASGGLG